MALISEYQKFSKKNADIMGLIEDDLQAFQLFLSRRFKVTEYYSWDSFRAGTWPEDEKYNKQVTA